MFGTVLPTEYTICSISRYTGGTKRRVLVSHPNTNWYHGHAAGDYSDVAAGTLNPGPNPINTLVRSA